MPLGPPGWTADDAESPRMSETDEAFLVVVE